MKKVSVLLKTGGHCIQTAAKNELKNLSLQMLEYQDDSLPLTLVSQFELLTEFLENTDFNKLRASDERYAGITEALCSLSRGGNGEPVITVLD